LGEPGPETRNPNPENRQGIFSSNPKFWESMSYLCFVAIFTWVVFNSQGESAFMMSK
jgi:hypothetical protein